MNKLTYTTTLLTIVIIRAALFTTEQIEFNKYAYVGGFRWHHMYTGIILCVIAALLYKYRNRKVWSVLLGIGLGLIIDEITLPLYLSGYSRFSYWAFESIVPVATILALFAIFSFRLKSVKGDL